MCRNFEILRNIYLFSSSCLCPVDCLSFVSWKKSQNKYYVIFRKFNTYQIAYDMPATLKLNLTAWLGCFLGETLHSNPLNNISRVEEIKKMFLGLSTKSQHDRIWLSESCKIYLQHRDLQKQTNKNKQN